MKKKVLKRLGAIVMSLALVLCLSAIAVSADAEEKQTEAEDMPAANTDISEAPVPTVGASGSVNVNVTIADAQGALALVQKPVTVTDIDSDNALTVNDALYCAHEAYYEGGAAAGYASAQSEYGLSLAKLWGAENGGSYGYYVNNVAAWGLTDPVADGDYVNAFVYTDLTAWSDTYCYFDTKNAQYMGAPLETVEISLILSAAGFDADWNPVTLPVAGAAITLNGERTGFVTDENGKVDIELSGLESGTYVISAVSDTQTLVPPACVYTVTVFGEEPLVWEEPQETVVTDPEPAIAPVVAATAPATGDAGSAVAGIALFGALCAAGLTLTLKRREK